MARGEHYPAGTLTVKGTTFEIATDDSGQWMAYVSGNLVAAETRDKLRQAIGRKLAVAKISVEVRFMTASRESAGKVRRGTATGIHSSSRNVLVRWDDGTTEQVPRYSGGQKYLRDSGDGAAEYARLRDAYLSASQALHAFEESRKFELDAEVSAALEAAVSQGEDS